ncbi:MerR family transcriptional regulator [Nocardia puris]|uniref:DNA-binding transcriptional MerR regulator n=1 Tax=Nocardia puris TaxID=208602 RepID=A0A366DE36_9NOCA|nr:MerR family transcriptional regulator [Nocardia puris]MBF6212137.1 MerR family transcriptional regulator [Nocardia puris]MBF6367163.1 MerR family transcriptional regulator [Nocardia puris]MBF6461860.1 MerR family transcriptional regulator [Nocardia puris]RBO88317.1 DNA-binding transcriptional MerR regulator [Nocardia puris]
MFSIGDFARHGRVSVRMLRHYDAIELLRPDAVDPATGYRFYEAGQLARLNRIVALKELGFTLEQVRQILNDEVSGAELRGMLMLRHAELERRIEGDRARLRQVETRLRIIEKEGTMPANDVVIKSIPAVRVAETTGVADSFEPQSIGPVVGPLFDKLCALLQASGIQPVGPAIAYYDERQDGTVLVHAALPVNAESAAAEGFSIVDLPAVERAATVVHRGSMDDVLEPWQALGRWVDANGYRTHGQSREVTLEWSEDPSGWVTELQEPITTR